MHKYVIIAAVLVMASCSVYYANRQESWDGSSSQQYRRMAPPPDFSQIKDINERKKTFLDYMRQGVVNENARIQKERTMLLRLRENYATNSVSSRDIVNAKVLGELYGVELEDNQLSKSWLDKMLLRVDVLPQALVLTQAANESAWGTSRFAKQAKNYFGQWCYRTGCGLVPKERKEGMTHEVAKFASVSESIHRYFMNVNRNRAYRQLRLIRAELREQDIDITTTDAAISMVEGLNKYSERGQDYVQDIQAMIQHNRQYWDN